MLPLRFPNLPALKADAYRRSTQYQKPVYLWECNHSKNGGRFAYLIDTERAPANDARLIGIIKPGVVFKSPQGDIVRASILIGV